MVAVSRFLIVDDSDANILFFQVLLQELGKTDVFTATTGAEAISIVEKEKIHFVITAWELAQMPGTVLVQKVRSDRRRMYMPCVIFSKRMSEEDVQLTKELGFDHVLAMPFDKDNARTMLQEMIAAEEELSPLERRVRKLEAFVADNKPSEALKLVDASLTKKSPFRSRVKTAIGETWILIKQYKKSEAVLAECLKETPDYTPAKHLLARLYSLTGRHQDAIFILEEASKNSPKNIKTLVNLGAAYVDADQHDEAKKTFARAESLDDDSAQWRDERGRLAFKEGDIPLAAQLLSQTTSGDYLARQFNNMAIAHTAAGNHGKAIDIYLNAIQILSDRAKVHLLKFNLGLAYRKNGDIEKSFASFCESYVMDPSFVKAYGALAKASKEAGQKKRKLDEGLIKKVNLARKKYLATNPPDLNKQKAS